MDYLKNALNWISDLVFPVRCIGCDRFSDDQNPKWLCNSCRSKIKIAATSACIGCGQVAPRGETCRQCSRDIHIDRMLAAGNYADPLLRSLITSMKYRFVPALAEQCFYLIHRHLRDMHRSKGVNIFENNPIIVPVPLHPYRQNWRGFNQAELIAHRIANTYQVRAMNALSRNRRTDPQANIDDPAERAQNIVNAFSCPDSSAIADRNIILVDDVCTSGSTLNACAQVLKSSGAKQVIALVVARG